MRIKTELEIKDIAKSVAYEVLEKKGIVYVKYESFFLGFGKMIEVNMIKVLSDKIKKLEKLTGFNADDYDWQTENTSKTKLVKKEKEK
jgi:hypothetical protein